jgi:spermidine synthase
LIFLGLPFLGYFFLPGRAQSPKRRWGWGLISGGLLVWVWLFTEDYENRLVKIQIDTAIRRDYAASTVSFGAGRNKQLFVNGVGMTLLTPATKFMAHLPLAYHQGRPQSLLIICFGMGTTYRSALSWDVNTTAVELVPGVMQAFEFYHADAQRWLDHPQGRIVIDDGRRYLRRTAEKFDVIVIDPPPPPEAAGSSLLYSREFYELAKQHLQPQGILQTWVPGGDATYVPIAQAAARSLSEAFPYTLIFRPVECAGIHMLASMEPIELLGAGQLTARMPEGAKRDLLEWSDTPDVTAYFGRVATNQVDLARFLDPDRAIRITDDRPYNEYFLLRSWSLF